MRFTRWSLFLSLGALALAGCTRSEPYKPSAKPAFNGPAVGRQAPAARSNQDLADIYAELAFGLESNERNAGLRRFEGPIRIGFGSPALAPFRGEVDALAAHLRTEAEIDIAMAGAAETPNLTIHLVPRADMDRELPSLACFVAFVDMDWPAYIARPEAEIEAAELVNAPITATSVYIPADSTPYDMQTCLTEEILQGLGLGNDLYPVHETIFNDDNAHGRATEFDMQMLRLHYNSRLKSRMPEAEARRIAREILDEQRPEGRAIKSRGLAKRNEVWTNALHYLSFPDIGEDAEIRIAKALEKLSEEFPPDDLRVGTAKFTHADVLSKIDPKAAIWKYDEARAAFERAVPPGDVRFALIDFNQALMLDDNGTDPDRVEKLLTRALPILAAHEKSLELGVAYRVLASVAGKRGRRADMLKYELEAHNWLIYAQGVDYAQLSSTRDLLRLLVEAEG
jgi:hypothetical protein